MATHHDIPNFFPQEYETFTELRLSDAVIPKVQVESSAPGRLLNVTPQARYEKNRTKESKELVFQVTYVDLCFVYKFFFADWRNTREKRDGIRQAEKQ